VFLTADHGAVHVPAYLQSVKIPAAYVNTNADKQKLNNFMFNTYKSIELIENVSNNQIFLNRAKLKELKLNLNDVQDAIVNEIITYENVDKAYAAFVFTSSYFASGIEELIQNGFNQKRSGDIIFVYNPATISYSKTGSTHGSGLNYDTHIPLLFFGKGINKGSSFEKTTIVDIAPTMSALLGISYPNGNTGNPINMVLKN
jgi:arylsulfatase A-like enzyme